MKKLSSFSELKSLRNNVDEDITTENQDKKVKGDTHPLERNMQREKKKGI